MDLTQSFLSDDASGVAKFFITEVDRDWIRSNGRESGLDTRFLNDVITPGYVDINLLITGASHSETDFHKIETNLGDSFGINFYGRSPITISFNAVLLDDDRQIQKYRLMRLYEHLFRISKVARYGIVPNIEFAGCVVQGALMNMNTSESSTAEDRIDVSFQMLVINFYIYNQNSSRKKSTVIFNDKLSEDLNN